MQNKQSFNIEPASRLNEVNEYYFSSKLQEIATLNAAGKNIISLGIGSPDLPPSTNTTDVLCQEAVKQNVHGYQSYIGIPEFRNGVSNWYKKWFDVTINPANEVLPLIGSKEGILHITMALVNVGDQVLVPNPGYPTYTSLSKLLGAEVIPYNLEEANNWQPNFEELEKQDLSRVKLMWVNYPNMPTGANGSLEFFEKLVQFALKHKLVVVNDNPYSFILNEQKRSIFNIPAAKTCCIELNSMSKSHNMPGWRVGMVVANAQFIQWILKVMSNIESGIFRPIQLAAAKALENEAQWHDEMNQTYRKRRVVAEAIMKQLECTFDPNQVGLFLWGKIPESLASAESLADKVLYEANVFITPGFIFGSNGDRYIRISLCCEESQLAEALERIKQLMP